LTSLTQLFLLAAFTLSLSSCTSVASLSKQEAETIYLNGHIYTVDSNNSWQQAMAVEQGILVALGSNDDVLAYKGNDTSVIDLQGKMVMPGIQDMHLHPMDGGITETLECSFGAELTSTEIVKVVRQCVSQAEPGQWIQGGQWGTTILQESVPPTRLKLDLVSPDNPVFLMDWSVHNAWVNTRALALLGINESTPNPNGGEILRNPETGIATGILLDNAAYTARNQLPSYTHQQLEQALHYSIEQLIGYGVTSFKDAITTERNLQTYQRLEAKIGLKARVKVSMPWKSAWSVDHATEMKNIKASASIHSDRLDASFVKIMLDGVPLTYTSAVLEPYEPSERYGDTHVGELMHEAHQLAKDVTYLDTLGMTIKIHATGDRAVRVALDAFEAARKSNGDSGLRHEISHAEMIHPTDIPRFAALNVAAEMCPILWYPNPAIDTMRITLGTRADFVWPVRTLYESGALVFYGSDWPAVVPNANPWPGIEAMVTREDPYERNIGALWPEQTVDLPTALRIFTINGAVAGKQDANTGSLEVGKPADFIILDRNLFDIPIKELGDTKVLSTVVGGEEVYRFDPLQ